MTKNPHLIWGAICVVFILIAAAVILSLFDKDVNIILTLAGLVAVPVLGAFGAVVYQKLDQVQTTSNGNNSDLLKMIKEMHDRQVGLALQVPPLTEAEKESNDESSTVRVSSQT